VGRSMLIVHFAGSKEGLGAENWFVDVLGGNVGVDFSPAGGKRNL
jgi:hypothetical protein